MTTDRSKLRWDVTCNALKPCGWSGVRQKPDADAARETPCPRCGGPVTAFVALRGGAQAGSVL